MVSLCISLIAQKCRIGSKHLFFPCEASCIPWKHKWAEVPYNSLFTDVELLLRVSCFEWDMSVSKDYFFSISLPTLQILMTQPDLASEQTLRICCFSQWSSKHWDTLQHWGGSTVSILPLLGGQSPVEVWADSPLVLARVSKNLCQNLLLFFGFGQR